MGKIWLVAVRVPTPHLCCAQGNELIVALSSANSLSGVEIAQAGDPFRKVAVYWIDCGKGEFRGTVNPVILQKVETDAK